MITYLPVIVFFIGVIIGAIICNIFGYYRGWYD